MDLRNKSSWNINNPPTLCNIIAYYIYIDNNNLNIDIRLSYDDSYAFISCY